MVSKEPYNGARSIAKHTDNNFHFRFRLDFTAQPSTQKVTLTFDFDETDMTTITENVYTVQRPPAVKQILILWGLTGNADFGTLQGKKSTLSRTKQEIENYHR